VEVRPWSRECGEDHGIKKFPLLCMYVQWYMLLLPAGEADLAAVHVGKLIAAVKLYMLLLPAGEADLAAVHVIVACR